MEALVCLLLTGRLLRYNPHSAKGSYRTPVEFTAREALRTRAMWLLVAYGALQFFASGGLMTHQITFLSDLGISPNTAAIAAFFCILFAKPPLHPSLKAKPQAGNAGA